MKPLVPLSWEQRWAAHDRSGEVWREILCVGRYKGTNFVQFCTAKGTIILGTFVPSYMMLSQHSFRLTKRTALFFLWIVRGSYLWGSHNLNCDSDHVWVRILASVIFLRTKGTIDLRVTIQGFLLPVPASHPNLCWRLSVSNPNITFNTKSLTAIYQHSSDWLHAKTLQDFRRSILVSSFFVQISGILISLWRMSPSFAFVSGGGFFTKKRLSAIRSQNRQTTTCAIRSPGWRDILTTATAIAMVAATTTNSLALDTDVRPLLKVPGGSASTSAGMSGQRTVVKTVTRGVNLEGADFSDQDFEGISFQQSILRQADFTNCNLRNASFFDADVSGAKFTNADLRGANVSSWCLPRIRERTQCGQWNTFGITLCSFLLSCGKPDTDTGSMKKVWAREFKKGGLDRGESFRGIHQFNNEVWWCHSRWHRLDGYSSSERYAKAPMSNSKRNAPCYWRPHKRKPALSTRLKRFERQDTYTIKPPTSDALHSDKSDEYHVAKAKQFDKF